MEYARFGGTGSAFGWRREGQVTLGGLRPDTAYQLICEHGEIPVRTDAQGAWNGRLLHDVPLCVALKGRPVLWDESRETAASAASLVAGRNAPAPVPREQAKPAPEPALIPDKAAEAPVTYRAPSDGAPVDALPTLIWPREAAQAAGMR